MKSILWVTLLFASSWNAHAGNEMGNGADHFEGDYGAAWFVGEDRTVVYCVEVDRNFGRSGEQVRADILSSWKKWLDYVSAKKLYDSGLPNTMKYPKILVEKVCDGNEDLRFKFGTEDAEVKREKVKFERPTAFSHRVSFDQVSGWGKGWVWFSLPGSANSSGSFPVWSDDVTFQSVLLHELGHVFGNLHISGTVMDRSLSQKLENQEIKKEWFGKIDQTKELISAGVTPLHTRGFLGGAGYFDPYRAFEYLVGRKAVGSISVVFRRTQNTGNSELEVKDAEGTHVFSLVVKPGFNGPAYSSDVPVFKRMRNKESLSSISEGRVNFGVLKHPTLGEVTALFEANMSSFGAMGPFGIKVLIDGFPQPLFVGFPEN